MFRKAWRLFASLLLTRLDKAIMNAELIELRRKYSLTESQNRILQSSNDSLKTEISKRDVEIVILKQSVELQSELITLSREFIRKNVAIQSFEAEAAMSNMKLPTEKIRSINNSD
jgi:multidrug resistance efflux pump